jgi:hypothetical protein
MNRFAKNLALFFAVAFLSCLHAEAQSCGSWQSVTGWRATFSMQATGSGVDDLGAYTWTISENGSFSGPFLVGSSPCGFCAAESVVFIALRLQTKFQRD